MAEVENPANQVPPHKKQLPSSMPNFDTLEGFATDGTDDYSTFKKLQRQLEYVWVFPKAPFQAEWLTVVQVYPSARGIHQR